MAFLPAAQLAGLQAAAERTMNDNCQIGTDANGGTTDNDGPDATAPSFSFAAEIICGLDLMEPKEAEGSDATLIDATIRLPIATSVIAENVIKITKRNGGTDIADLIYRIHGDPRRGQTALVAQCSLVTGDPG